MKTLWTVVHHHRHGVDIWLFRSESEPTTQQILEAGVDFEKDREDEFLDIFANKDEDIIEL